MPDVPAGFVADEEEAPEGFVADEVKPSVSYEPIPSSPIPAMAVGPAGFTLPRPAVTPPTSPEGEITGAPLPPWQAFRGTVVGQKLFGPPPAELEAMGGVAGSRQGVVPTLAATMPMLPIGLEGIAGKALMGYFTADFIKQQPEIFQQAKEAYDRKDWTTLRNIVIEDVLGGAMMGVGAKQTFFPGKAAPEPPPPVTGEALKTPRGSPPVRRPLFQLPDTAEQISSKPIEPEAPPAATTGGALLRTAPEGKAEPVEALKPTTEPSAISQAKPEEQKAQAVATPTPPAAEVGKGEVKPEALAQDWTTATQEQELGAGIPIPKFADVKMSPLDKATTSHSAKVQTSFDEARRAQRDIAKVAPKPNRQNAISIWLEAKGDLPTLQNWATLAKGKLFKQAAIDAQTLTPLEMAIANKVRSTFDTLYNRGQTYDVLNSHRDNYVTHIWDVQNPSQTKGLGLSSKRLKENFKWAKARTFQNFFEGDQAGFVPRTLEIGKILPAYLHEMNQVIADRQFIKDIAKTPASDTRPLAVPRGRGQVVEGDEGKAYLIFPHAQRTAKDASGAKIDQSDYRIMEGQPALNAWRWMEKDEQGNPIFLKGDLALHPEAYRRINAMVGQSELKRWMQEPVSGISQVPRAVLRGLDRAQSEMKGMMFGLLAPFHQVQEGTHAIGHIVNPFFGLERVDMRKPKMVDAARHGLMLLPDRSSAGQYLEGSGASRSLLTKGLRKIPKAGEALADVIDGYQDYLFHQYIPALKYKTYEALLSRNMKLYSGEISAGTMTPADVKLTSAQQANAAYGHLNYALLDRNPTIQHLMRLTLLAPDFLEARSRFVGQAVKGMNSKVGHEQFKAVAVLAAVQAGAAYVLSKLLPDSHWDPEHPFELVHKNRRYLMRSVPEDLFRFGEDIASALTGSDRGMPFIMARVNPLVTRGAIQGLTGLNYRGEKVTLKDTLEELMAGYIPITARWIPGLRQLTQTGRQSPVSPLQELSGSLGLRVSRYSPISETYKTAAKWMDKQGMERPKGSYPVSQYQQLRYALEDGDLNKAREEYLKLKQTQPNLKKLRLGFRQSIFHPFTQSQAIDKKFSKTLTGYDKELYDLAVQTRKNIARSFDKVVRETESKTPTWDETEPAGFQPE